MLKYKHNYKEFVKLHQAGWSLNQISKITGMTNKQIGHSLRRQGIKPIKYDKLSETEELEQVIIGGLLGDSYASKKPFNSESYIHMGHSVKQKCYLEYKKTYFDKCNLSSDKGITVYRHISERYKKGYCDTYNFDSKVHPFFTTFRNEFYPDGKKVVPLLIDKLSALGLAIWYMDDGQVCTRSYQINSTGFTKEDCTFLIVKMKEKFDLDFTLQKDNILYLRTSSIKKFEEIICPFVPDCMKYKIRKWVHLKSGELSGSPS